MLSFRFGLMARLCCGLILSTSCGQALAARDRQSVYYYQDRNDRWCALSDYKRYRRASAAESEARFDVHEGSVTYHKGVAIRIEEFQMNAEAEGSLFATYTLNPTGIVISAVLGMRDYEGNDQPMRDHTYSYLVRNGAYKAQSKQAAEAAKATPSFRKARALSAFPVAPLLERARAAPAGGPFCK